jgi:hypothetical protein
VTLLDVDGPGYVSCLHVSRYINKRASQGLPPGEADLVVRVWYDHRPDPAIEMPLMDFLGDIEAACDYFSTLYFCKVKESHNLRLPMPFREHITIQVENRSPADLFGYSDVQWEETEPLPADCGYLSAQFCRGGFRLPFEPVTLWDIATPGSVVAHWLQLEADDPCCRHGETLCEANDEIYLGGDSAPTLEYLGTEDLYCHSWGFQGTESDIYSAIVRREALPNGGARVAMLRVRAIDRIRFQRSCRMVLNYQHDILHGTRQAAEKGGVRAAYRSCVYYYRPA